MACNPYYLTKNIESGTATFQYTDCFGVVQTVEVTQSGSPTEVCAQETPQLISGTGGIVAGSQPCGTPTPTPTENPVNSGEETVTPTPTPTDTPTPTPTPSCYNRFLSASAVGAGDVFTIYKNECNVESNYIYSSSGAYTFTPQELLNGVEVCIPHDAITLYISNNEIDCPGCSGPVYTGLIPPTVTPTPTPTNTPTPTPTPTGPTNTPTPTPSLDPCAGFEGTAYLSAGRLSLEDFCYDPISGVALTWQVTNLVNLDTPYYGDAISPGITQVCDNHAIMDGRDWFYLIGTTYDANVTPAQEQGIKYVKIDSDGYVQGYGTISCTGGGGNGQEN